MSIRWTLLSSLSNNARSSHCAAVTSTGHLLLYSGELRPRVPVDNSIHVFDLEAASSPSALQAAVDGEKNNNSWRVLTPLSSLTQLPQPRVGATATYDSKTESLYVWGGRGGVDMAPLGHDQAGIWQAKLDGLATSDSIAWERQQATNQDSDEALPATRSFHASVIAGGKLYVHAGCPASGRLGALHAFDFDANTWYKCADAPAEPRGGTAIAPVTLPSNQTEQVLVRFGGFAGLQLPKVNKDSPLPLDIYTPSTNAWHTVYPTADPEHGFPGPRSVHGLVPFTSSSVLVGAGPSIPVALLYFGERDASSLGHAGAGMFWDDAWLLLASSQAEEVEVEVAVEVGFQWKKLNVNGTQKPEGRGWFSPASYVSGGKTRVVLTGGLLSSNERSGEVWIGDVEL